VIIFLLTIDCVVLFEIVVKTFLRHFEQSLY